MVNAANLRSKRPRQEEGSNIAETTVNADEDPAAMQPNSTVLEPAGAVNEEDWQRRHVKRLNVIHTIKTTAEYQTMSHLRAEGLLGTAAPATPNAHDRMISKRKWESVVMHWRNDLRQYTRTD
jgi:hypothetical protein